MYTAEQYLQAELIAVVTHEANRAYCLTLGDDSQKPWNEAAHWQRKSAIDGVLRVITGQAKTPEEQHEAWSQFKIDQGWTWGPEKDEALKQHPCLVPYAQLPVEQQKKDAMFQSIVLALV